LLLLLLLLLLLRHRIAAVQGVGIMHIIIHRAPNTSTTV
jgi:hypothetical protein